MAKFAVLFVSGLVPEEARAQNTKDWTAWFAHLKETGHLVGSARFGASKVISGEKTITDYEAHTDSNVSGYCVVEADSMDQALQLAMESPQLRTEYGSGNVEVRELIDID